jgi:hypothetical protein
MNVPLALCEARDTKGLYKLARAGKIKGVLPPPPSNKKKNRFCNVTTATSYDMQIHPNDKRVEKSKCKDY